jgi:hypothetical protein
LPAPKDTVSTPAGRRLRLPPSLLLGLLAVAAARLLTLPQGPWEQDEVLFVRGVERFSPAEHRPHPPGYPLLIGLGKLGAAVLGDPFRGLVGLSVLSSLVGFAALAWAYRDTGRSLGLGTDAERLAVAGALLFHLSPAMLLYGPLALSDPPPTMFLAVMLAGAARLRVLPAGASATMPALALGAGAAAAIGCRPQLVLAAGFALLVALLVEPVWRRRWVVMAGFAVVALAWGIPLVVAGGGVAGLLGILVKQAGTVAEFDAGVERAGHSLGWVLTRFLAHPWGPRPLSIPILALALYGAYRVGCRSRAVLPLVALGAGDLLLCVVALHPADAVRYALPSLLLVAFLSAAGLVELGRRLARGFVPYLVVALLVAGFVVYAAPLLRARTRTPSPAMQAVTWGNAELPATSAVMVEPVLAPFASEYLARLHLTTIADGLDRFALRGDVPLWLLGDGESAWPGAVVFAWPDSDAYGKLTRGVLRVVSLSPLPPEGRYRPLRGVHAYEPSVRERRYRWLDGDAAIAIAPRGGKVLAIALALPASAPWPQNRVTIAVDDGPPQTVDIGRGTTRTVLVALPVQDRVEVKLRSERTFVAAVAGLGSDRRSLAVQLLDCRVAVPGH